jgi:hypothetical protein
VNELDHLDYIKTIKKTSLQIIPSRIEERCMILFINEELGGEFPLVSMEEFLWCRSMKSIFSSGQNFAN